VKVTVRKAHSRDAGRLDYSGTWHRKAARPARRTVVTFTDHATAGSSRSSNGSVVTEATHALAAALWERIEATAT
jgi:hypothetical protein